MDSTEIMSLSGEVSNLVGSATVKIPLRELDGLRSKAINAEARAVEAESKAGKVEVTVLRRDNGYQAVEKYSPLTHQRECFMEERWGDAYVESVNLYNLDDVKGHITKHLEHRYAEQITTLKVNHDDKLREKDISHQSTLDKIKEQTDQVTKESEEAHEELVKAKEEIKKLKEVDTSITKAVKEYQEMVRELTLENQKLDIRYWKLREAAQAKGFWDSVKVFFK